MPTTLTLRYQKQTPYKEHVFIAVDDPEKHPEEEQGHEKLSEIAASLKNQYPDVYLPTFAKDDFSSIRFKMPNNGYPVRKFYPGSTYEVTFTIKKKVTGEKTYLNAFLDRARLVGRAQAADDGEELEF